MSYANEPTVPRVREEVELPPDLPTENAAFLPGWQWSRISTTTHSAEGRGRLISVFCHCARVIGLERLEILRRGVARILADLKGRKFNALEITVLGSRSFLGMILLNIAVNPRHFQCNAAV
jgi:hypothetical protein